jgi:hypothetical protein
LGLWLRLWARQGDAEGPFTAYGASPVEGDEVQRVTQKRFAANGGSAVEVDLVQAAPDFRSPEPTVAAQSADGSDLASAGPTSNGFRVDPEERSYLGGGEE